MTCQILIVTTTNSKLNDHFKYPPKLFCFVWKSFSPI